jgi:hypothetical protein
MSRLLSVFGLATVLGLLSVSTALAEEKPAVKKTHSAAAKKPTLRVGEAAIEKTLAEPTEMEFVETPLSDAIDYLKEHHHIEVQLDKKALDDVGIGSDTPITKSLKGGSLRSALNLMLRDLNLTWLIKDEVLLITTPEEAEATLTVKVYDVSDLVVCRDKDDELWDDYDTLIDMLSSSVMPTTWDCVGGPGSIAGDTLGTAKVLIVNQTSVVHEKIVRLLADVREIAKKNPNAEPPQRDKPAPTSKTDKPPQIAAPAGGTGMF